MAPTGTVAKAVGGAMVAAVLGLLAAAGEARSDAERDAREAERIAELLRLAPGMVVADVGAGGGEWSLRLARRVTPGGRVYATEVEERLVREIRQAASGAGISHLTAIRGDQRRTGLPPGCCDAVLLRKVYHHLTDPQAINRSLYAALRPGGLLAVIDYRDHLDRAVDGVPGNRSGHGLDPSILVAELSAAGFEPVELIEEWPGRSNEYCALFRRP